MNRRAFSETIFHNGPILTMSDQDASAVLVCDDAIEALGSLEEMRAIADQNAEVVDLNGHTLMPAFIDAHMHLVHVGLKETGFAVDFSQVKSLDDALELVRSVAAEREPGSWIRGRGWDEMGWPERRPMTRDQLDKFAPDHNVALTRVCGHMLVANSNALKSVKITADADEFDQSTGSLRERAVIEFSQQTGPSDSDIEDAIVAGCHLAHSLGITSLHDFVSPKYISAYMKLHRRGALSLRITMHPFVENLEYLRELGFRTGFGDEGLKLGAIKFFTDGSVGARNAAFTEPYSDTATNAQSKGKLNYKQLELNSLAREAHEAGFQLVIHAIGDRAIAAAIEAIEFSGARETDRPRIEHLEFPSLQQLEKMAGLGIIASMQPNFVQWSGPESLYEIRLGSERDSQMDPHRAVLRQNLRLAFGSDGMPLSPLYGIHMAVNAPHENQRLSVDEALKAYTSGAAYSGFEEGHLGSLEPGKKADFVILSANPNEVPDRISQIKVVETYRDGECINAKGANQ